MQTKHTLATVAASLLLLTACNSDNDQQANNQNSSDTYTKRLFLGGGHLTACSSMTPGDCNDWDDVRATTFADIADAAIRTPQSEAISISEQYITRVLSTSAWQSEPEWQSALDKTFQALQVDNPSLEYDSWDTFKSAFIDVSATSVDTNIDGVDADGDYLWYNSSSDQWDALHYLKMDDGLVQYTPNTTNLALLLDLFAENSDLSAAINTLEENKQYPYIDLVNALSPAFNSLSIEDQYRILRALRNDVSYERPLERVALSDTNSEDSINAYQAFVSLAAQNKPEGEKPTVLVMTSSSNNNYDVADFYVGIFAQTGANSVWLPIDRAYRQAVDAGRCEDLQLYHDIYAGKPHQDIYFPDYAAIKQQACEAPSSLLELIASADGLFINGGSQSRSLDSLITELGDSEEMALIRERYQEGKLLVGGSSAGTAVMTGGKLDADSNTNPMIDGGTNYDVLVGGYPSSAFVETGGLGLFTLGVTDTHFSERARETRLIKLLQQQDTRFGFGVDETTALIVKQEVGTQEESPISMSVVGAGGVYIIDMNSSSVVEEEPLWITDVKTHFLREGDMLEVDVSELSYDIQFSEQSSENDIDESVSPLTNDDILYTKQDNYRYLAQQMIDGKAGMAQGTSYEDDPTYSVVLKRGSQSKAVTNLDGNSSYQSIMVDITYQY
ncbi:secreted cyanophycinase CphE [Vibrio variabilis]|uniref:Secreted cyanophycinase CphE n=1 Tax=Vibrio variabilis TaxID=990271 RepID=A0ABQ0JJR6_9VIBR|nr:secreted cyanophycinase CphE [Vibrio variabilis]